MTELDVMTSLLKVIVVFALLGVSLLVLRRVRGVGRSTSRLSKRVGRNSTLEVIEQKTIGRATLAVVRFRGQDALISVSDDKVTVIAPPEASVETDSETDESVGEKIIDLRHEPVSVTGSARNELPAAEGLLGRMREMTVRR